MTAPLAAPPAGRPDRLVFLGTPDTAVSALRALHGAGHEITLVVTRGDKRRRRRGSPEPSAVKAAAVELGLDVSDRLDDLATLDLDPSRDLGVVVAYGRLIPRQLLERLSFVNVHFSLLPRWRGAAPVQRAVLAGDTTTTVCA